MRFQNRYYRRRILPRYTFDEEYEVRNRIREATYAKNSFKTMLDNRFFGYEKGILLHR